VDGGVMFRVIMKTYKLSQFFPYSGIYAIRCIINGRIYVGQSLDIPGRITTHLHELRLRRHINKELQEDYADYGSDNFEVMILSRARTRLDEKEKYHAQRLVDSGVNIYNIYPQTRTPEEKRKAREHFNEFAEKYLRH
jgi:group I intron endonuclease